MPHILQEWRPESCHVRLGDIILGDDGKLYLEVKCRRCTKNRGHDVFHRLQIGDIETARRHTAIILELRDLAKRAVGGDADMLAELEAINKKFSGG